MWDVQGDAVQKQYFVQLPVLPVLERLEPADTVAEALLPTASSKHRLGGGGGRAGAHLPRHDGFTGWILVILFSQQNARGTRGTTLQSEAPPRARPVPSGRSGAVSPTLSTHARTSSRLHLRGEGSGGRRASGGAGAGRGTAGDSRKQHASCSTRLRTGRRLPAAVPPRALGPPLAPPSVLTSGACAARSLVGEGRWRPAAAGAREAAASGAGGTRRVARRQGAGSGYERPAGRWVRLGAGPLAGRERGWAAWEVRLPPPFLGRGPEALRPGPGRGRAPAWPANGGGRVQPWGAARAGALSGARGPGLVCGMSWAPRRRAHGVGCVGGLRWWRKLGLRAGRWSPFLPAA